MKKAILLLAWAVLPFCMSLTGLSPLISPTNLFAQEIRWKKNFGGSGKDEYLSATAVSDGIIAVGDSRDRSFGNGDWGNITGKGDYDAIIVKYDNAGNVVWKKNFGGGSFDYFYSVTTVSDGIIAVGDSYAFGAGDWEGVTGKGDADAIIVKFDHNGNVVWKKNFGGNGRDRFDSVTTVSDGIIAAGSSEYKSFGNGDWVSVTGQIDNDAIIVKYDYNGNVLWKKSWGTNYSDSYTSVTAVSGGIIAVGQKYRFYMAISYNDAMIAKYDNNGNLLWNNVLNDYLYCSVAAISDGVIAVGSSGSSSTSDAVMVKYDNAGNILWQKNFGGKAYDEYKSITVVADGMIVSGYTRVDNTGDWAGFTGHGIDDAMIVKYDFNGNVVWKKNFGGKGYDRYNSVVAVSDGIVAVGESYASLGSASSFGNGDWTGIEGKGEGDAIIVKYTTGGTGIANPPKVSSLKIYPNPAGNDLYIIAEYPIEKVELYNLSGTLLRLETNVTDRIDVSRLTEGLYLVRVYGGNQVIVRKVIVKK